MNDERKLFDGLGAPLPSEDLRVRVLSAAHAALLREPAGRWTKIWESRPLRISWAAAMALLALAHLALFLRIQHHDQAPVSASARRSRESELARAISLPRMDSASDAWTALGDEEWFDRSDRFQRTATLPRRKEKSS